MQFRQWNDERHDWALYRGGDREHFFRPFEIRVTFSGRKYFERLEALPREFKAAATTPQIRLRGVAEGKATIQAKLDSSPQPISTTIPRAPKVFVSHATQDRQFVDKFTSDLRRYGVDAWYSPWEIKLGDSIPAKIDEGLEGCEFLIFVMSRASLNRPWVQTELDVALARKNVSFRQGCVRPASLTC